MEGLVNRKWLKFGLAFSIVFGAAHSGNAQNWPEKNVTILVPFAAGSTPDLIARVLAEGYQARTGKTFLVENRPGASGNTATNAVAKATPDGHTIGVSIVGPLVINPLIMASVPYDPQRDIAPISIVASQPNVVAVHPSLGVKSIKELVDVLKKDPGKYNFGSIGKGSLSHLSMEALLAASGTRAVHVVFPGSPAAVTALVRGDVQMASLVAGAVAPMVADGKLAMLATSLPKRTPLLPGIPTMAESGIAGVEADAWTGLIAPGQTPQALQASILEATRAVLGRPEVREKLRPAMMEPVVGTTAEFKAVLAAERARWEPLIRAGGIKVD
jgi:tripartite-type tricarboxylate transporter receptor subunit TctC